MKPPKEDRATVSTLLDVFHAAIVKADTQTKTFVEERGNDPEFAKADAAAKAYGLKQCGQASG